MLRTLTVAALLATLSLFAGCIVSVKSNDTRSYTSDTHRVVSGPVFTNLVECNKNVRLGMSQDEVLAQYPADLVTKFDAAEYDGRILEVWQVYAYSQAKNAKFERWLYFVDDSLVEMSRSEIDYTEHPEALERWLNG
ncbi:MAG: hypothetical protein R3B57_09995 [Phycisphaerales bacterium]